MEKTARQIQKERTREKIMEAAYEEFGKRGIMATRMSDVAKAAGVSHGTVFVHFGSQEALITAVIGEYGQRITARAHQLAESRGTVREILAAHLEGIEEFEPFYTRLVVEARLLPALSRDAWVSAQAAVASQLNGAARKEMQEGRLLHAPVYLIFNTWAGLIHYYLANGDMFSPDGQVIKRCGGPLLDFFMKLIAARGAESPAEA